MSGPYLIRGSVSLPEAELIWRFSRSSGPGGQHVNTSDSQVELRFDLAKTEALPEVWKSRALERLASRLVGGVISVRASEHRSQWRNRETAAVRLASLLAEATAPPPKPRRATKIPRGINERRLREKKQRAPTAPASCRRRQRLRDAGPGRIRAAPCRCSSRRRARHAA